MSMDDSMSSSSRSDPIMEKAHLSSLPLPSVSTGTLSSVQAACDDLGKCEDPVRILHRLKALHKALVRSPVDAYDPSETFLAIQGVTQRFLPPEQPGNAGLPSSGGLSDNLGSDQPSAINSLQGEQEEAMEDLLRETLDRTERIWICDVSVAIEEEGEEDEEEEEEKVKEEEEINQKRTSPGLLWSIAEAALLATAALACVCVGPAWHAQLRLRRFQLAHRHKDAGGIDYTSTVSSLAGPASQMGKIRSISSGVETMSHTSQNGGSAAPSLNPDPVTPGGDAPTSMSGDTGSGEKAVSTVREYPTIPEALPAALLRYAQSILRALPFIQFSKKAVEDDKEDALPSKKLWVERMSKVAIGQRLMVLALCCDIQISSSATGSNNYSTEQVVGTAMGVPGNTNAHDSDTSATPQQQWTIPGAHELVGRMLLFWLDVCDCSPPTSNTRINSTKVSIEEGELQAVNPDTDRWHVLAVTRAVVDLIATGWRPLPESGVGPRVVEQLLAIAKAGIEDLYVVSTLQKGDADENINKVYEGTTAEQFLISLSSSAEALSALTALGTRSLIPQALVESAVVSVCRLRAKSGLIRESLMGSGERWLQLSNSERAEYLNQLASCLADTAEFLVVLCTNSFSSTATLFTLLSTVATSNPRSEVCTLHMAGQQWNKRDKIVCLESQTSLRVLSAAFCRPSLPAGNHIRCHLALFLSAIRDLAKSLHELLHEQLAQETIGLQSALDLMSLALDVVVALGGFCRYLFEGNEDQMNAVEWDIFFLALEESLFPWFGYIGNEASLFHDDSMIQFLEQSHIEVQSVLLLVGALLDKFTRIEASPFRSIVDYQSQRRLFKFILTNIVPSVDPTDGELLGLSATRAWVKFGLFPFQLSGWRETATEILGKIFCASPDSQSFVHSPHLRLVALKALVAASHKGTVTPGGPMGEKGNPTSNIYLAGGQGDYHSQVTEALIPVIKMTISRLTAADSSPENETTHYRNNQEHPFFSASRLSTLNEYCLELAGCFVLDTSVNLESRKVLLTMIISLALKSEDNLRSRVKTSKPVSQDDSFSVRLKAIEELEKCLVGAFVENLLETWVVSPVIDSFCALLTSRIIKVDDTSSIELGVQSVASSLSALLVLLRLRLGSHDSRVGIRPRDCADVLLPDSISKLLHRNRKLQEIGFNGFQKISLLVKENEDLQEESVSYQNKSRAVSVSFDKITDDILSVLEVCRSERRGTDAEILELQQCLSSLCFHTLTEYWLSGVSSDRDHVRKKFLYACSHATNTESINEALTRRRSLGIFLQCTIAHPRVRNELDLSKTRQNEHLPHAWELFMRSLSEANHETSEVSESIKSVVAILPSLARMKDAEEFTSSLFEWIADTLQEKAVDGNGSCFQPGSEVWMGLFGLAHDILLPDSPAVKERDLFRFFEVCSQVLSSESKANLYGLHLALRCAALVIDTLTPDKMMKMQSIEVSDAHLPQDTHVKANLAIVEEDDLCLSPNFPSQFMRLLLHERSRSFNNIPTATDDSGVGHQCSYLEKLAIEWNNFESFEVELDSDSRTRGCSTWFDGKSLLLSLRVGSLKSRYRGWVEVMVRTPTTRMRKVIRLFNKLSLKEPHRPMSLWSTEPIEGSTVNDTTESMPVFTKYNTEGLLEKYHKLTSRFDEMVPTSQIELHHESLERVEAQTTQEETKFPPADRSNSGSESELEDEKGCIRSWLSQTLENEDSVEDVLTGLQKLGISHQEITEDSWTDHKVTSNDEQFVHGFFRRLEGGARLDRSLSVLDRTIPCNTHKIALLYSGPKRVGLNGDSETILLSNKLCSPAFHDFSERLGSMIVTRHLRFFSAGLDVSSYESDGHFTRAWVNRDRQRGLAAAKTLVVYHIPYLMPEGLNQRKRHVGNDNVLIVFVDKGSTTATDVELSPAEYSDPIVSGHFNFVTIYVSFLPTSQLVRVTVRIREKIDKSLRDILCGFTGTSVVHFENAADVVRSLAVRADLACRTIIDNLAPASNPHERFKMLQRMERYVEK